MTSSPNPSSFGETVTLTATIPGASGGTVTFFSNGVSIGTAAVNGSGVATLLISTLPANPAPYTLTAAFGGQGGLDPSTSSGIAHKVDKGGSSINLSSTGVTTAYGQPVTFTAAVTPILPALGPATGSVAFYEGVSFNLIGTTTLNGAGQASLTISSLPVGAYSIAAEYLGSTNLVGVTTSGFPHTVTKANTTTTVLSSVSPSVFGQPVTFTATISPVSPGSGSPTGTITFKDGAATLGVRTLAGGSAALSTDLSLGGHTVTAEYSGDASFNASTGATSQTVNQSATTTALVSSPNPSTPGNSVTLTATVSATAPGSGARTGTISFFDGATLLGSSPLNGTGQASFSTTSLGVGSRSLTAAYSGDANFTGSTSPAVTHVVSAASTSTALSSSANPSTFNQSVTFTATVTSSFAGTPTGTVTFRDGATTIGTATLNGAAQATFSTIALSGGSHSITAVYSGDGTYAASTTGALSQTVNAAATATAVSSSASPTVFGQAVTFTASVTSAAGTPTGTVTLRDGAATIGSGTLSGTGQATLTTSALGTGSRSITAVYSGDTNFAASTSAGFSQAVNQAATSTALASATNPSVFGQPVTLTATVTVTAPGTGAPSGTITFKEGAATLGSASIASGQATLSVSSLGAGTHALTAVYSGDANFGGSTSTALNQTVNAAATSTAVTSSPNPSSYNQSVTFTATVSAVAPGAGTPTGSITFKEGATTLGTATLNASRQATFSTSALAGGSHTIVAVYNGDASFGGSTSPGVVQAVNKAATTITLAVPASVTVPNSVTFTATVTSASGAPTGTVTFRDGSTVLGTSPLNASGSATGGYTLTVGNHSISATYNGDANFATSTSSSAGFGVNLSETRVSVPVLRSGNAMAGETLTIAATVTSEARLTGMLTLRSGPATLASAPIDPQGTAVVTVRLPIGLHLVVARYEGDVWNATSSSEPLFLRVRGTAPVRLVSSANPSGSGAAVTFTATVSAPEASAPAPTGTVSFSDGATALGTATLTNGQAIFTATGLAAGEHSIVAAYSGDQNYVASSSTAVAQRVTGAATTTTLDAGVDANGYYLTASVTGQGGTPGGLVRFEDFSTAGALGSATLVNGSATVRLAAPLPVGRRLRAVYAGDSTFGGSASAALPFIAATDAFSFTYGGFAQDAITSIFGSELADGTVAAPSLPLPETLGGVSVKVVDASGRSHAAGLYFVSAGQVNIVMPGSVPPGPARLSLTNGRGTASLSLVIRRSGPSLATADGSGSGAPAAHLLRVHADGSQDPLIAASADVPFGEATDALYLILYGTGFRHAQGGATCSFNDQPVAAMYAGPHATYPGLDQINVQAPNGLRGSGRVSVSCAADGLASNTVAIGLR